MGRRMLILTHRKCEALSSSHTHIIVIFVEMQQNIMQTKTEKILA